MIAEQLISADSLPAHVAKPYSNSDLGSLHVSYDAASQVLLVHWEGDISSDDIRSGYHEVMEQVHVYKPSKILLDFHNRVTIRRRDQRWVFSTVFPEILRTVGDNVFVAIVLPVVLYHGLVTDINGDELMHDNNFLIIHHSLYREEAFRWLDTMYMSSHKA